MLNFLSHYLLGLVLFFQGPSYFGYVSPIGSTHTTVISGATVICGGPYSISPGGTLTAIELYNDDAGNYTFGLYSDYGTGPLPNLLLANSAGGTLAAGPAWRGQSVSYSLVAGTNYWFCAAQDPLINPAYDIYYDSSANHGAFGTATYMSGSMPADIHAGYSTWGLEFNIRGVYTPAAGGASNSTMMLMGVGK